MTIHPSIPPAPAGDDALTARLTAIRARIEAATPGPWLSMADAPDPLYGVVSIGGDRDTSIVEICREPEHDERIADMALIAAAPSDLAYLLDGLLTMRAQRDAARAEAARLREALGNLIDDHEQSDEPQYYAVHVSDFDAAVRALDGVAP